MSSFRERKGVKVRDRTAGRIRYGPPALDVPTYVHGLLTSLRHLGRAEAGPRAIRGIDPTFHFAEHKVIPRFVH